MNSLPSPEAPSPGTAFQRFRLAQPSSEVDSSRPVQSATIDRVSSCHRCRKLKKKCSRTLPECQLCRRAGVPCSISDPLQSKEAVLQARVNWLSRIVNERLFPNFSIEEVETGTDFIQILDLVAQSRSPPGTTEISPSDTSHEESGVAAVLTSLSSDQGNGSRGSYVIENTTALLPLPSDAACRRFVDAYFRHVHRAYPFADRKMVTSDLDRKQTLEKCKDDPASLKLYLIMAIGCTTLERAGQIPDSTSRRFTICYPNIIQQFLKDSSVESVEILLLLSLYSLFDPSGLSPWTLVGILTRQAVAIGITRGVSRSEQLLPWQVELRHRLFWSIFVLDRMISTSLGLPLSFNDENPEISLPGVTVEEFGAPDRVQHTILLQNCRHIIQLRQLEEKILRKVHLASRISVSSLNRADKRTIIEDLRSHIENWYSQGCLLSPSEIDNIPFHNTISWLTVRYYNLLLLLHGPSHFNSEFSPQQLTELQQYIQKYVRASGILLQQRQLPLNWITLYRFLSICSMLLFCFARRPFTAKIEITMCAEILESFLDEWTVAKRSAKIFLALAGIIDNYVASPTSTQAETIDHEETLRNLIAEASDLTKEVFGKSSAYNYLETLMEHSSDWDSAENDMQFGSILPGSSWQRMGPMSMNFS
ncbi:Fungal specific transcription factor domain containing protein [Hyaloscypha variabilis]